MKKLVSVLLAAILLVSLSAPVLSADAGLENFTEQTVYAGFSDVSGSAWYADSVKTVCEYGLMKGKSAGRFSPAGNITAAETLAIACRLHDIYNGGSGEFEQSAPWYQVYIDTWRAFAANGFQDAVPSFWASPITRELFASIIEEALPADAYSAINTVAFGEIPDVDLYSPYAGAIYTLYNAGILTGATENGIAGIFHPERSISRAEASAILARVILPQLRQTVTLSASIPEPAYPSEAGGSTSSPSDEPAPASGEYDYILNINTNVFHYPWCKSVKRMNESNKQYYSGSRESVIAMGYRACGNCNP